MRTISSLRLEDSTFVDKFFPLRAATTLRHEATTLALLPERLLLWWL